MSRGGLHCTVTNSATFSQSLTFRVVNFSSLYACLLAFRFRIDQMSLNYCMHSKFASSHLVRSVFTARSVAPSLEVGLSAIYRDTPRPGHLKKPTIKEYQSSTALAQRSNIAPICQVTLIVSALTSMNLACYSSQSQKRLWSTAYLPV